MKPQTSGLVVGKLKRKVLREPVGVALNGKIQGFGGNAVEFGQVCIEHDLLAAEWRNEITLRSLEMYSEYEPGAFIERIAPTPLLMVLGDADVVCPTDLALA